MKEQLAKAVGSFLLEHEELFPSSLENQIEIPLADLSFQDPELAALVANAPVNVQFFCTKQVDDISVAGFLKVVSEVPQLDKEKSKPISENDLFVRMQEANLLEMRAYFTTKDNQVRSIFTFFFHVFFFIENHSDG